ncbi:hypothetical protein V6Z12_A07G008900 [Gossypium hirsutum]
MLYIVVYFLVPDILNFLFHFLFLAATLTVRLQFYAQELSGLLVIEKGQVLMAAKEDVGSLLDCRLLDLSIGKASFIKDILWQRAAKYNFLVLTKKGKLFHGKYPDPSLTELMDGIDAVESSGIGDIVVAKQNNITVFSSDLNEKMIIPLSSELWLGVPMGGVTLGQNFNVG